MYDFHYNYIKRKYGKRVKLFFTEIEAKDVYADFWKNKDRFDNSDYNKELTKRLLVNSKMKPVEFLSKSSLD